MIAVIILLCITGFAILTAGIYLPDKEIGIIVSSIGAAIAGASFSGVFNLIGEQKSRNTTQTLLEGFVTGKLISNEEKIAHLKKKWYHYGRTLVDDKEVWRHAIIDLSQSIAPGVLSSTVGFPRKDGDLIMYSIEGFVRDYRVVLVYNASNPIKPSIVEVLPFMAQSYKSIHTGYWLLQTWGGKHMIQPTIFSEKPINRFTRLGEVDAKTAKILQEAWDSRFEAVGVSLEKESLPTA